MPERSVHTANPDQFNPAQNAERKTASTLTEYGKIIIFILLAALILKLFVVEAYRIPSTSMENTLKVGDFIFVNKLSYGLRTPRRLPFTKISIPNLTIPLFRDVNRGDVIVFEFPGNQNEVYPSETANFIKRCIGLPGDKVEIRNGIIQVNGIEIPFPSLGKPSNNPGTNNPRQADKIFPENSDFTAMNYGPILIPKKGDILKLDRISMLQWGIFIEREGHNIRLDNDKIIIDNKISSTYKVERDYYFVVGDNRDNSLDSRYWGFLPDDRIIGEALFIYWSWDPEGPMTSFSDKVSAIKWKRIGTLIR